MEFHFENLQTRFQALAKDMVLLVVHLQVEEYHRKPQQVCVFCLYQNLEFPLQPFVPEIQKFNLEF